MENIINLEQLDYRDQLIKDYIDDQQGTVEHEIKEYVDAQDAALKEYVDEKVQPQPGPAGSSGDMYYDYATWQKPYVRRGSNVIFARTEWVANPDHVRGDVFLEVGCLKSNTPADEDTRVTYTGSVESTPLKPLLSYLQTVVEDNELHIFVENPLKYDDYSVDHCDYATADKIKLVSKMPDLIDLTGYSDFIQAIEGGTDVNLTMNFPKDDNDRDPGKLRLYVCVDMSMAMFREDESVPDLSSCFVNIYSDKNSGEWKFKITPQQTVKVKYHRTQFTVANGSIRRSKYVGFEDFHTSIKPEEFLRQIIGNYDPDSDTYCGDISFWESGLLVRRCVKNYEPEKGARSCQFRWTYKPTKAKGDYMMKIAKATGMYYLDKFGDNPATAANEYYINIKRDMRWFARTNKTTYTSWDQDESYRRGACIDFLVGSESFFGKTLHYKGINEETGDEGTEYHKIRFTCRPMHIRIMSIVNIDKETIKHKVKYLGNVDPLKIPY